MLRKNLGGVVLAAVAGFALLLTPDTSQAQRRGGWGGGGWRGGGWNGGGWRGGGWRDGGWYGWGLGFGYPSYSGWGWGNSYYATPTYSYDGDQPNYYYSMPATTYYEQPAYTAVPASGYYGTLGQQPAHLNTAGFLVRVPDPNAQIWFQDYETKQKGTAREFESAPLQAGKTYTFHVRAHWMQNGQPVDQTRDIQAQAGQRLTVDFTNPQGARSNSANEGFPAPRTGTGANPNPQPVLPRPNTSQPASTPNSTTTNPTIPPTNPGPP
jgi:uncharacterized protein (TIGR03000 family)